MGKDHDLRERFRRFHEANPEIYKTFKAMALKVRARGFERYGAWAIFNVIRWEKDMKTSGDPFKISNDFIALYSRLLVKEDKAFAKFFGIKQMKR